MNSTTEIKRTSLAAPASDLARLREIAQAQDLTLSQELRRLIRERITEVNDEAAA